MNYLLFASFGFMLIGIVATILIYAFGARRLRGTPQFQESVRWTFAFAISICTFCGVIPFLTGYASWLIVFPFLGIGLSLDSIGRIISAASIVSKSTNPLDESITWKHLLACRMCGYRDGLVRRSSSSGSPKK